MLRDVRFYRPFSPLLPARFEVSTRARCHASSLSFPGRVWAEKRSSLESSLNNESGLSAGIEASHPFCLAVERIARPLGNRAHGVEERARVFVPRDQVGIFPKREVLLLFKAEWVPRRVTCGCSPTFSPFSPSESSPEAEWRTEKKILSSSVEHD